MSMLSTTGEQVRVVHAPEWIVDAPYDALDKTDDTLIAGGLCILLRDSQLNLADGTVAHYTRVAYRIVTQTGAEQSARFSVAFDPLFQWLDVHGIRVLRGDTIIEHAKLENIDLMRRETDLERRVLNGRITATLIIPDVRPGDIVEQCWTIYGSNPALQGLFSDWFALEAASPALCVRLRLRTAKDRPVATKIFGAQPVETAFEQDAVLDRRWSVERAARMTIEPLTPPWHALARSIQLSEAESWGEIANLFSPLYFTDEVAGPWVGEAERIKAKYPDDPSARLIDVLQTVQRKVRYLSLSLGEGGLAPRKLDDIWTTGYGDCKDSAKLFVTIARLSDIDAAPALVASRFGPVLGGFLPSATVFDHCIVRVRADDKTYWLDPTRKTSAASASHLTNMLPGWALPLVPDGALEEMTAPVSALLIDVHENIEFGSKVNSPATLGIRIDYFSGRADRMHDLLANQGLTNVSDLFKKRYQADWPELEVKDALHIEEEPGENRVTATASFTIRSPWKRLANERVECSIPDHDIAGDIALLATATERKSDIFLGMPRILRRHVELKMPKVWNGKATTEAPEIPGLKYRKTLAVKNNRFVEQDQELVVSAMTAPASAATGYSEVARALADRSTIVVSSPVNGNNFVDKTLQKTSWRMVFFIIWVLVFAVSLVARAIEAAPP